MNKLTTGQAATNLLKNPSGLVDAIEQQREMQQDYIDNLVECVERYKKIFPNDFYMEVLTSNVLSFPNVIRNRFYGKLACPTPKHDRTVYKYHYKDEQIEFLWTIPSQEACVYLRNNVLLIDKEEKELLNFVLDFDDGTLLAKVRELNNENELPNQGIVCKTKK